jgi:hypothetical protein
VSWTHLRSPPWPSQSISPHHASRSACGLDAFWQSSSYSPCPPQLRPGQHTRDISPSTVFALLDSSRTTPTPYRSNTQPVQAKQAFRRVGRAATPTELPGRTRLPRRGLARLPTIHRQFLTAVELGVRFGNR